MGDIKCPPLEYDDGETGCQTCFQQNVCHRPYMNHFQKMNCQRLCPDAYKEILKPREITTITVANTPDVTAAEVAQEFYSQNHTTVSYVHVAIFLVLAAVACLVIVISCIVIRKKRRGQMSIPTCDGHLCKIQEGSSSQTIEELEMTHFRRNNMADIPDHQALLPIKDNQELEDHCTLTSDQIEVHLSSDPPDENQSPRTTDNNTSDVSLNEEDERTLTFPKQVMESAVRSTTPAQPNDDFDKDKSKLCVTGATIIEQNVRVQMR